MHKITNRRTQSRQGQCGCKIQGEITCVQKQMSAIPWLNVGVHKTDRIHFVFPHVRHLRACIMLKMDRRRKLVGKLVVAVMAAVLVHVSVTVTQPCDISSLYEDLFIHKVHQPNALPGSIQDRLCYADSQGPTLGRATATGSRESYKRKAEYESQIQQNISTDKRCCKKEKVLRGEPLLPSLFRSNLGRGQGRVAYGDTLFRDGAHTAEGVPRPEPDVVMDEQGNVEENIKVDLENRCIKKVHIFSSMHHMIPIPELHHFREHLQASPDENFRSDINCVSQGYNCGIELTLGDKLQAMKGKDAVIFGMVPTIWKGHNLRDMISNIAPDPAQTWIYYSTESPFRASRWAEPFDIGRMKYHVLMTYNREADIHIPFGYYRRFNRSRVTPRDLGIIPEEFYRNRSGLLSWVASNCNEVFWPRMPFISKIMEEIPLDDYGACGSKECLPRRSDKCNRLFASYKFFLAIPNSECRDYITEKFWMISLKYGTVPLILGAPKEDYERVAPPGSFVHFSDFENLKELSDYLHRVDQDNELYMKLHEWRYDGEVISTYPLRPEALCRTLPHIHPRKKGDFKFLGDSVWYKSCRTPLDNITVNQEYIDLGNWTPWK